VGTVIKRSGRRRPDVCVGSTLAVSDVKRVTAASECQRTTGFGRRAERSRNDVRAREARYGDVWGCMDRMYLTLLSTKVPILRETHRDAAVVIRRYMIDSVFTPEAPALHGCWVLPCSARYKSTQRATFFSVSSLLGGARFLCQYFFL
jgi:hypothetical protein